MTEQEATIEERDGAYVVVVGGEVIAGPFPDRLTAGLVACSDTKRHLEIWQERRRRALAGDRPVYNVFREHKKDR